MLSPMRSPICATRCSTGTPQPWRNEIQSPPSRCASDGYVDFRTTGRDIRLRIEVAARHQPFTVGQHLVDALLAGIADGASPPRTLTAARPAEHAGCVDDAVAISAHFQLWCRHGFADKLSATTAQPGVMLQATDDPTKMFMIQVIRRGRSQRRRCRSGAGKP